MDVVIDSCNCTRFTSGSDRCRVCGSAQSGPFIDTFDAMPRLIAGVFSGALTGVFALAGAFTGAFMGAIAGRASDSGMLRGAGVGAIAGAVLAVEVLEASRAYWCLQQSGSRGSSSMADFAEELLRGRFVDNELTPTVFVAYNWQVTIGSIGYDHTHDASNNVVSRGLCRDLLKKLPCHILDEIEARKHVCCTICLQDIKVGETARSLPNCNHTFHLGCVDKWLISHGSCPVCRREL